QAPAPAPSGSGATPEIESDEPTPIMLDSELIEEDDDPRTAYRPPDAQVVSPSFGANAGPAAPQASGQVGGHPQTPEGSPLERTVFIAPNQPAPSPVSPAAKGGLAPAARGPTFAGAAAEPPQGSHPGRPAWQPMPVPLAPMAPN